MIDHLMKFASEDAAKADAVVGAYWNGYSWVGGCIPGLLVWQPASDTTETAAGPDGNAVNVVTHHPITDANGNPYWYILISTPAFNELLFNAALLTADRDAADAGQPFVLGSALAPADLASYCLQPTFAGSNYPFGAV